MYLRILCCLLLISCTGFVSAQDISKDIMPFKTTFIRWNGLGLGDMVDPNISFGAEHRLNPDWSVTVDAAWIIKSRYYQNTYRTNGFIIRSSLRRYSKRTKHNFAEVELHYKTTYHYMHDWLGRDCVAGISSYEEYTQFKVAKNVLGLHLEIGKQYPLGQNNRWWLEGYLGAGVHLVKASVVDEPNSCYTPEGLIVANTRSWQALPALPMGFRLLYKVR